jgi:hypothetical protein
MGILARLARTRAALFLGAGEYERSAVLKEVVTTGQMQRVRRIQR